MPLNENQRRCTAKSKRSGKRCKNPAVKGYNVCRMHGAHPPGKSKGGVKGVAPPHLAELNTKQAPILKETMKGNTLSVIHGANAKRLLSQEEFDIYDAVKEEVRELYKVDLVADEILLHELAFRCAKEHVATIGGADRALAQHSGRISTLLRQLAVRRDKRPETTGGQMTIQHMIVQILGEGAGQPAGQLPPERKVIEAQIVDDDEENKQNAEIMSDNTEPAENRSQ